MKSVEEMGNLLDSILSELESYKIKDLDASYTELFMEELVSFLILIAASDGKVVQEELDIINTISGGVWTMEDIKRFIQDENKFAHTILTRKSAAFMIAVGHDVKNNKNVMQDILTLFHSFGEMMISIDKDVDETEVCMFNMYLDEKLAFVNSFADYLLNGENTENKAEEKESSSYPVQEEMFDLVRIFKKSNELIRVDERDNAAFFLVDLENYLMFLASADQKITYDENEFINRFATKDNRDVKHLHEDILKRGLNSFKFIDFCPVSFVIALEMDKASNFKMDIVNRLLKLYEYLGVEMLSLGEATEREYAILSAYLQARVDTAKKMLAEGII